VMNSAPYRTPEPLPSCDEVGHLLEEEQTDMGEYVEHCYRCKKMRYYARDGWTEWFTP